MAQRMACVDSFSDDFRNFSVNSNATNNTQFCSGIVDYVPRIYLAVSVLSAVSCLWVFATYFMFPRLQGYSSKVFMNRALVDLLIAVGHIVSFIFQLPSVSPPGVLVGCSIVGVYNEFLLMAGNLWYAVLGIDLIKAIRNPFRAKHSYSWPTLIVVWGCSLVCIIVLSGFASQGPGVSMFYWCWITVRSRDAALLRFSLISLFLYYIWHFILWAFSFVVLIFAACVLWGHLAASSDTRKFVLKQNAAYVLVLGVETAVLIPLWIAQQVIVKAGDERDRQGVPLFLTKTSWALAIAFAIIHSLRGTVDLLVWWLTYSIGPSDFKNLYQRVRLRFKKDQYYTSPHTLCTPLIGQSDSAINKALRRDAIYCINIGILDAVKLNAEDESLRNRLGSVREPFVAQAMVLWDEENQENVTAELHENPFYREQSERKIEFPPTGSIQKFSFADIEPSVFSLLRNSYGIGPRLYRDSFKIKNAVDVESSGMLEKFTEGKSGSFFYFTRDFRYIIKTVTASEERFLQRIAYRYYRHMRTYPDSVIVRFFGLHKVRLAPEQRYITVVVMENIFNNDNNIRMHEKYDLKGSTVGRRTLKNGRERAEYKGTLKDLDLNKRIVVGPEIKAQLLEQLRKDVEFLSSCRIMDYSMLLGLHHHTPGEASGQWLRSEEVEVDGGEDFQNIELNVSRKDGTASPMGTFERGRHNSRLSETRRRTLTVESMEESDDHYNQHVPWFRRDYGGLRSYSPFHPCSVSDREHEGREQASITVDEYRGLDLHSLPVDTYYFGIVDILQPYNLSKSLEHLWKTRVMCKDGEGISAVREGEYGRRFLKAMDRIFE